MNDIDFKNALGQWPSGVSTLLSQHDDTVDGITVSSFTSVSLDPPLVLVSIDNDSSQLQRLPIAKACTLSILGVHQAEVSNYFANSKREALSSTSDFPFDVQTDLGITDASAQLFCSVERHVVAGDHTLVLLAVNQAVTKDPTGASHPLVYWFRKYRALT